MGRGEEARGDRGRRARPAVLAPLLGVAATLVLGVGTLGAPEARSDAPPGPSSAPSMESPPAPRLPPARGPLAPSALRTTGAGMLPATLRDVDSCAPCHADAVAQWRSSAHAQSSFGNPFYRASVEDFGVRQGPRASLFCAGCHDPVLALAGGMDRGPAAVSPDDPLAQVGVSCLVCHGGRDPGPEGNGALAIDLSPVPIPVPGDDASLAAHVERLRPPALGATALCGSCHRAHLEPSMGAAGHLPGMDDLGAWSRSPWSGSVGEDPAAVATTVPRRRCPSCHMPGEAAPRGDLAAFRGRIRSHRFPGAQTDLAAGDPQQRRAVADTLERAVTVHVAGVRVGDRGPFHFPETVRPEPGDDLVVDVVVNNVGAGHSFPGGTRDLQGAFVSLELVDSRGRRVAGGPDDRVGVHPLRATIVDRDGVPERLHRVDRFVAPVADTTVPARTARAYRFRLETPAAGFGVDLPLRLTARVIHRRHDPGFRSFVCKAERTPRGRRFRAAARRRGVGSGVSGCGPPASIVVASDQATVGGSQPTPDPLALALVHGRALAAGLGDRDLTDARHRVLTALRRAPPDAPAAMIAQAQLTLARVAGRLGRTRDALGWLVRSAARVGPDPAIDRIRGDALVRVWRFPEAAVAYRRAARANPRDPTLWRALARAAGSAGDDRAALAAAHRGLAGLPHDPALLRSQALALRALGAPGAGRATEAWLSRRLPDDADRLAWRCGDRDPACRSERAPIPEVRVEVEARR